MKKIVIFIILFSIVNSKFNNIQGQSAKNPEYAVILSITSWRSVYYGENYFSGGKRIPIYSLFGYETPIFLDEKTTHTSSYSKELGNLLELCRIKQIEVTNLIEDIREEIISKDLFNDLFSYYGHPEPKFRIKVKEKGKERKLTKKYERVLYRISNSDAFMPYLSISSVLNKALYPNVSDNSSIYRLEEILYTNLNKNILLPMFENEEVLDAIVYEVVKLASKGYDEEYHYIKDEYEKELILSDIKLIAEEEVKEYMKIMQSCVERLYNTKIKISKLLLENIFYNYYSRFGDIKSYSLFYLKKYWFPNNDNYLDGYDLPVNAEGSRIFPEYKDFNDFYNHNK